MNKQVYKVLELEILKRLIALEEAKMLFDQVEEHDAICRVQAFIPGDSRSKLIRVPALTLITAIESGLLHTKRELREFKEKYATSSEKPRHP